MSTASTGGPGARVALVLVSHAREAADGVARIAGQMAPDVVLVPSGGTDDGGLGTSVGLVTSAVERAAATAAGAGVVVLTDLGSAVMTAETVLELVDDDVRDRVALADAPFLEGAVSAAVTAQQGGDRDAVVAAAEEAGRQFTGGDGAGAAGAEPTGPARGARGSARPGTVDVAEPSVTARVVLPNPLGLHARPAAVLAHAVADLGVPVTVDGADGASVLELMALGAGGGHELTVTAEGPRAQEAVDAVVALVSEGFGEV